MAANENGQNLPVETRIAGQVTKVNMKVTPPLLFVGEIPISLSQIEDVKVPELNSVGVEGAPGTQYVDEGLE